ncbi:TIGR02147 family protein [Bdellovibrio sp. HCB290]|uniref:TIGR02147 family protein n=1 Tax=Bdellovibrio sp. HCB290 TaxID=3394356 RepID=UPI0039B3D79F
MTQLKDILRLTYKKRYSLNPKYSQNAFARDLGVSPTALSQFLSNKRDLAPRNVVRVVEALGLPFNIAQEKRESDTSHFGAKLDVDVFSLIAEWHHFGILNLVEVSSIKSAGDISKRLGISEKTAEEALTRLMELGMLERSQKVYKRTGKTLDAGTDIPSAALRRHNREKMELAIASLETVALEERDVSSLTLAFDPSKMADVKNEITKFKKRIYKLCKSGQAREVYSMNVQFFPLSKKG